MRKKPVDVQVSFARDAGTLETLEGPVRYVAGTALLTGAAGDRWPVERAKFDVAYAPAPGLNGIYRKRPIEVLAMRLRQATTVRVGPAGDLLQGRPGDWLVQYGPDDHGIVGAEIFVATYEFVARAGGVDSSEEQDR